MLRPQIPGWYRPIFSKKRTKKVLWCKILKIIPPRVFWKYVQQHNLSYSNKTIHLNCFCYYFSFQCSIFHFIFFQRVSWFICSSYNSTTTSIPIYLALFQFYLLKNLWPWYEFSNKNRLNSKINRKLSANKQILELNANIK